MLKEPKKKREFFIRFFIIKRRYIMKTISLRRLVSLVFVFIVLFTLPMPALATSNTNTETYSVIFKAEKGGRFYGDVISSSYKNLPYGSVFPTVPKEITEENYEFLGWYDENGNKVDSFPSTVTRNYVFTAKWSNGETTPVVVNFVVKHFLEQLDGTYLEIATDTNTPNAEVGEIVSTNPNTYENYTFNEEKSISTGTVILPEIVDGNLNITTLELYYDLNSVEYKIEHYLQDSLQGDKYSIKDTKTVSEKIGTHVVAKPNTYDKYVFNKSLSTITGVVKDELVLKLYYDLEKIADPSNPPVGDNIRITVFILVLSFVLLILLLFFARKKRTKHYC